MHDQVKELVFEIMSKDKSGHGTDHVSRVYDLAIKFARAEHADEKIVALAALLHDVDDYKLVGKDNAEKLINAKSIMKTANVPINTQERVLDIIKNMGFSNYLKGIRPKTLEGKIVSDADMCDALGANGIIRSVVYAVSDKGSGTIFDKNIAPILEISSEEYNSGGTTHSTDNAINHFFEKLLRIKNIMLTKSGAREAGARHDFMIKFLHQFFTEENAPQEWFDLLEKF